MPNSLTLRNYRCFTWAFPATLYFDRGFTAFIGPNNSGKTSALRSIYELRNFLEHILYMLQGNSGYRLEQNFLGVADPQELPNESSPGRFEIEIKIEEPLAKLVMRRNLIAGLGMM